MSLPQLSPMFLTTKGCLATSLVRAILENKKIMISILCEIENVDREREKEIPEPAWPSEMSMVMARTTGYCILAVVVIFKETGSDQKSGRWV